MKAKFDRSCSILLTINAIRIISSATLLLRWHMKNISRKVTNVIQTHLETMRNIGKIMYVKKIETKIIMLLAMIHHRQSSSVSICSNPGVTISLWISLSSSSSLFVVTLDPLTVLVLCTIAAIKGRVFHLNKRREKKHRIETSCTFSSRTSSPLTHVELRIEHSG